MANEIDRVLKKNDGYGERWARYIADASEAYDGLTLREARQIVVGIVAGIEPPDEVAGKRGGLVGLLEELL